MERTKETILGEIEKNFQEKSLFLYAVLDDGVAFGIYKEGICLIRMPQKDGEGKAEKGGGLGKESELDFGQLRELRVFNKEAELRAVPVKEKWVVRYKKAVCEPGEYAIEEYQKLWGKVTETDWKEDIPWSLLCSERGTRIWIPIKLENEKEAAIKVIRIMRTPKKEEQELVYQSDLRIADICEWNPRNEEGEYEA